MAAIYSNGGFRWDILGISFTKRDALSSVYKISMGQIAWVTESTVSGRHSKGHRKAGETTSGEATTICLVVMDISCPSRTSPW